MIYIHKQQTSLQPVIRAASKYELFKYKNNKKFELAHIGGCYTNINIDEGVVRNNDQLLSSSDIKIININN